MDAEFQRALAIVLIAGSVIMGAGAFALFYAFRAFGSAKAGRPAHLALIAGLIMFVFLCCLGLLALSYR